MSEPQARYSSKFVTTEEILPPFEVPKFQKSSFRPSETLFGIHPVKEALKQERRQLHCVYLKHDYKFNPKLEEIADLAEKSGLSIEFKSVGQLDRLTDVDNFNNYRPHQGVCLRCRSVDLMCVRPLGAGSLKGPVLAFIAPAGRKTDRKTQLGVKIYLTLIPIPSSVRFRSPPSRPSTISFHPFPSPRNGCYQFSST